ncbi:replication protein A 70 kDa DNA-binding subunit B-like [Rhododendron vialii]|uniref:replication protein A 70 kDa DNA-binding subunit B-like n=1 Tax=Rhododendron vialii TaxID=182163 RepID=UPI0026605B44|nr:replication protein A 70 kDa DNA-binding subunit B-like [Rhododendron vialii]
MAHSATLQKIPPIELYQLGLVRSSRPHQSEIITVNRLPTIVNTQETHWVKVVCKVTDWNQRFYYMSCSKCTRATAAQSDAPFWCNYCKERVHPMPRCKFQIQLSDSTGFIIATAFGEQADSMFSITGDYLKNSMQEVWEKQTQHTSSFYYL